MDKETTERLLGDLIAVIHRDGGHFQADYGTLEAYQSAKRKVLEMLSDQNNAFPAAYQQFRDGKWVECSQFVAMGFGSKIDESCRALYTGAPKTPVATPKEFFDVVQAAQNLVHTYDAPCNGAGAYALMTQRFEELKKTLKQFNEAHDKALVESCKDDVA